MAFPVTESLQAIVTVAVSILATIATLFSAFLSRSTRQLGKSHPKERDLPTDASIDKPSKQELSDIGIYHEFLVNTFPKKELDPAERQYLLLKAYHEQSLGQSRITMWFSLIFAAIGFLVIVGGFLNGSLSERLVKIGSGVIIDAVASLFFVQSNKARELMVAFFDKLRTDRKLDESLQLVQQIPDAALRARIMAALALNFADVKAEKYILFGAGSTEQSHQETAPEGASKGSTA